MQCKEGFENTDSGADPAGHEYRCSADGSWAPVNGNAIRCRTRILVQQTTLDLIRETHRKVPRFGVPALQVPADLVNAECIYLTRDGFTLDVFLEVCADYGSDKKAFAFAVKQTASNYACCPLEEQKLFGAQAPASIEGATFVFGPVAATVATGSTTGATTMSTEAATNPTVCSVVYADEQGGRYWSNGDSKALSPARFAKAKQGEHSRIRDVASSQRCEDLCTDAGSVCIAYQYKQTTQFCLLLSQTFSFKAAKSWTARKKTHSCIANDTTTTPNDRAQGP